MKFSKEDYKNLQGLRKYFQDLNKIINIAQEEKYKREESLYLSLNKNDEVFILMLNYIHGNMNLKDLKRNLKEIKD